MRPACRRGKRGRKTRMPAPPARRERHRGHPLAAELKQLGFRDAKKLGQSGKRRISLDAAMMTAAANWSVGSEHHVAELDRLEDIVLDRVIHPGARDALTDE